jgi:predicted MPP superfamily phosphohydrolase
MPSLRWLHLTDLHCGMSDGRRLWPSVKDELFEDLRALHGRSGAIDLVLFTGDLTQRGSAEEFAALDEELDELWEELDALGSRPALVAVPGNHDLVRPDARRAAVRALRPWHDDEELRKDFWDTEGSEYRAVVTEAFANYTAFCDRFSQRHPWPEGFTVTRGTLPGDVAVTVERGGLRTAVVGLNTAFLQLDGGDYERRLDLDLRQLTGACGRNPPRWLKQHHLTLLLTHHPTSWLHPRARDEFRGELAPPGRFFAHLFGHMHEARTATTVIGGADALREVQGASLLGLEAWGGAVNRIHGYAAGGVDVDGDRGDYHLWPRALVRQQAGGWQFVPDPSYKLKDERVTERFIARVIDRARPAAAGSAPERMAAVPVVSEPMRVGIGVSVDISLKGGRFEGLVKALLSAFPTSQSLARLVRFKLALNLEEVAAGNLSDQTFSLVQWAEAHGRVRELIEGACAENPTNPILADFARTVGAIEAAPAPAPVPVALSPDDTAGIARELRAALERLYALPADAMRLAADAGVARSRVDFSGPMQVVWFHVLEEAAKSGRVAALVDAARRDYPQEPTLERLARVSAAAPFGRAAAWTRDALYDALVKLLPGQFEAVLFRLALPTHYLPPAAATLAERAVALVRVVEQQGRLAELGAMLEKMGVRA